MIPGPSGSFESPLIPEAVDAPGTNADPDPSLVLGALLDELGLVWCAEHEQLEPAHTDPNGSDPNGGTNMGFPQPEPEAGYF